ncbi:hypothetical protein J2T20_004694 [Paenibacillus wynnii]|nr:hypothetical protein [Paenibacillus wynnii]
MKYEGNFRRGLVFGVFLSIPLWVSMIGWIQLL